MVRKKALALSIKSIAFSPEVSFRPPNQKGHFAVVLCFLGFFGGLVFFFSAAVSCVLIS